jgi:catechol 2,3-dioxygenase
MANDTAPAGPVSPTGINHLVLNVRDLDESHAFWTEILGFRHVGTLRPGPNRPANLRMRFYSSVRADGTLNHHDLALVENPALPAPPADWGMFGQPSAINHIAVTMPSREAWIRQMEFMQARGIKFRRRVDHGMTHSVYITDPNGYGVEVLYELPREIWEGNVDDALNYAQVLPTEGEAALQDKREGVPVFGAD